MNCLTVKIQVNNFWWTLAKMASKTGTMPLSSVTNADVFFYLHKTTNDVLLPAINHGLVGYHIQGLFKWSQPKIIASLWSPLYFSEWFKIFYFNLQKKSMFWVQIHNPTTHNLSLFGFLTNPSNSVYPKLISSPCSGIINLPKLEYWGSALTQLFL